ncbi:alpha-ketoglutarate-dependent dioxygenase alkB homolog 4 [Pelobates cultripes]|uniref:Alpha-ketoglutarate-dependent dioxygenase alkB homolog 4 n=1 Tax=Pelobates cultripes TaxID=61616 RepID=A0AAD1QZ81_PELCU|nr:alpha-ketoglutarate-dependent dioxygenase alkB homolog 4 [Pelobates cultripes]
MAPGESRAQDGCGCKGIRSCLLCEDGVGGAAAPQSVTSRRRSFIYSPVEGIALGIENTESSGWGFPFPGVCLIQDFVTEDEERELVQFMDQEEWKLSQSGRRKQDFGPKVNFKKQRLKVGNFTGLPSYSQALYRRMKQYAALEGFLPVEQCNLDYNQDRGSAIDPHFDDSWLWGERLVSLNLLSSTVLTMTSDSIDGIQLLPIVDSSSELNNIKSNHCSGIDITQSSFQENAVDGKPQAKVIPYSDVDVAIHLPRRSLVVVYGDARYKWKHAIHRENIKQRRVCSTFRELSAEFSSGGKEEKLGQMLLEIALGFQGTSV